MSGSFLDWPSPEDRHRQIAHDLDDFAKRDLADIAGTEHQDDDALDAACREIVSRLRAAGFREACCQLDADAG